MANKPYRWFETLVKVVSLVSLSLIYGCAAQSALKGEPGIDITSVKPGLSRAQVEAIVQRSTDREWTTPLGVRYRIYTYSAGVPPSAFNALGNLAATIATLGLVDLYAAATTGDGNVDHMPKKYVFRELAVSYDSNDRVIGVFDGIDSKTQLPADGRMPAK